jgi:restriction system protein
MSYAEAAYSVLQKAGKPLHYRELTRAAIEQRLIEPEGKTPEATMNAILAVDIQRKGASSRFARTGRGFFALREAVIGQDLPLVDPQTLQESDRRVRYRYSRSIPRFAPSYLPGMA